MFEKATEKTKEKEIIWVLQCTGGTNQIQPKNIRYWIAFKNNDPLNVKKDTRKMSYLLI